MKLLYVLALVLLLVGTLVGEMMVKDPGYVLLSYNHTTIETSIWGLFMVVVVAFVAFYLLIASVRYLLERRKRLGQWNQERHHKHASRRTLRGLLALSAGEYNKAERLLAGAVDHAELPVLNLLAAARAAHEQGHTESCDDYLQQARKNTPKAESMVDLVQAQIQLDRGQLEPCASTLRRLRARNSRHLYVMKLQAQVYQRQQDWSALAELMPQLKRYGVFKDDTLSQMENEVYLGLLSGSVEGLAKEIDDNTRVKTLTKTWKTLPKEFTADSKAAQSYIELLVKNGSNDKAEALIKETLAYGWDETLIGLYGRIQSKSPEKQLAQAQSWEQERPDNAVLQLTLGRLAMMNQQWQQARLYFERSLKLEKSAEAYHELSRLLHRLNDMEGYQQLMDENLQSVTAELPDLPLPPAKTTEVAASS